MPFDEDMKQSGRGEPQMMRETEGGKGGPSGDC